tara:strand:- start:217 stop:360 length:144 start_codon:yes stop_codon:yes gene_type:complete
MLFAVDLSEALNAPFGIICFVASFACVLVLFITALGFATRIINQRAQ